MKLARPQVARKVRSRFGTWKWSVWIVEVSVSVVKVTLQMQFSRKQEATEREKKLMWWRRFSSLCEICWKEKLYKRGMLWLGFQTVLSWRQSLGHQTLIIDPKSNCLFKGTNCFFLFFLLNNFVFIFVKKNNYYFYGTKIYVFNHFLRQLKLYFYFHFRINICYCSKESSLKKLISTKKSHHFIIYIYIYW